MSGTVDSVLSGPNAQAISGTDIWTLHLQYDDAAPRIQGPFVGLFGFSGAGPSLLTVGPLSRFSEASFGVSVESSGPGLPGQAVGLGLGITDGETIPPRIYFSAPTSVIVFNDQKLPASSAEWDFMAVQVFTLRAQLGSGADLVTFESDTLKSAEYSIIPEPGTAALLVSAGWWWLGRRRTKAQTA